jgi:GntR family transcriptional regulator/MocR family aminotransferase
MIGQGAGKDTIRLIFRSPFQMELHIVLDGRKDLSGQLYRQLREAIRAGLCPLTAFYAASPGRQGLFFGFGAIDSIDINSTLDRLLRIFRELEGHA